MMEEIFVTASSFSKRKCKSHFIAKCKKLLDGYTSDKTILETFAILTAKMFSI